MSSEQNVRNSNLGKNSKLSSANIDSSNFDAGGCLLHDRSTCVFHGFNSKRPTGPKVTTDNAVNRVCYPSTRLRRPGSKRAQSSHQETSSPLASTQSTSVRSTGWVKEAKKPNHLGLKQSKPNQRKTVSSTSCLMQDTGVFLNVDREPAKVQEKLDMLRKFHGIQLTLDDLKACGDGQGFVDQALADLFGVNNITVSLAPEDGARMSEITAAVNNLSSRLPDQDTINEWKDLFSIDWNKTTMTFLCGVPVAVAFGYSIIHYMKTSSPRSATTAVITGMSLAAIGCETFRMWAKDHILSLIDKVYSTKKTGFETQFSGEDLSSAITLLLGFVSAHTISTTPTKHMSEKFLKVCNDFSRCKDGLEFGVSSVINLVERAVNFVRVEILKLDYVKLIQSENPRVTNWINKVNQLIVEAQQKKLYINSTNAERILSLEHEGMNLVIGSKTIKESHKISADIAGLRNALRRIATPFEEANLTGYNTRAEPTVIYLQGASGVGKSAMTIPLGIEILGNTLPPESLDDFEKNHMDFIYVRQHEHQYWDGFNHQFLTVFDDFGQTKDIAGQPDNEFMDLIRCANLFPNVLHMAHLEHKGNTTWSGDVILLSTNLEDIQPQSIIQPEAVKRRIDIGAIVCPSAKYSKEGIGSDARSRRLDPKKIKGAFDRDVYEIHEYNALEKRCTGVIWTYDEFVAQCVSRVRAKKSSGDRYNSELQKLRTSVYNTRKAEIRKLSGLVTQGGLAEDDFHDCKESEELTPEMLIGAIDEALESPGQANLNKETKVVGVEFEQSKVGIVPTMLNKPFPKSLYTQGKNPDAQLPSKIRQLLDNSTVVESSFSAPETKKLTLAELRKARKEDVLKDCVISKYIDFFNSRSEEDQQRIVDEFTRTFTAYGKRYKHYYVHVLIFHYEQAFKDAMSEGVDGILDLAHVFRDVRRNPRLASDVPNALDSGRPASFAGIDHLVDWSKDAAGRATRWFSRVKDYSIETAKKYPLLTLAGIALPLVTAGLAVSSLFSSRGEEETPNLDDMLEAEYSGRGGKTGKAQRRLRRIQRHANVPGRITSHASVQHGFVNGDEFIMYDGTEEESQVMEAQGGVDEASNQIANKIACRAMYRIVGFTDHPPTEDQTKRLGQVLFVQNRDFIMPLHFAKTMEHFIEEEIHSKDCSVILEQVQSGVKLEVPITCFTNYVRATKLDAYDICLCRASNNVPLHPNMVKFFLTEDTLNKVKDFDVRLTGVWKHTPLHIISKAMPMDNQQVNSDFGVHTVRKGYIYCAPTTKGDCGWILCLLNPATRSEKILGMHTAGFRAKGCGFASAIMQEDLVEAIRELGESLPVEDEDLAEAQIFHAPFKLKFMPRKQADPKVRLPTETNIVPSKLYGAWQDAKTKPAALCCFKGLDGEVVNPMRNALMKYERTHPYIMNDVVVHSMDHWYATAINSSQVAVRRFVLSYEEAVAGIPGELYFDGIPRDTSAGYPLATSLKLKGKYAFWGKDGPYDFSSQMNKDLQANVEKIVNECRNGRRPRDIIFTDFLKDERRPIGKVDAGKTRLVSGAPLAYVIAFRQYFLSFSAWMMSNHVTNGSAVGINVYSGTWNVLYERQTSKGKKCFAGDFSNFDGSLNPQILSLIVDYINKWYDDGEENARIRRILFMEVYASKHVNGDRIYQWLGSLPSGHPLTTIINTIYNLVLFRICWVIINRWDVNSLEDYSEHVADQAYGDDNHINVTDAAALIFNQNTVTKAMALIGMTYTNESKTEGEMEDTRDIGATEFLKRTWRYEPILDRMVAPLTLDTVLEMAMWTKSTADADEITRTNVDTSIMELSLHGDLVFSKWLPQILKASRERLDYMPVIHRRNALVRKSAQTVEFY